MQQTEKKLANKT